MYSNTFPFIYLHGVREPCHNFNQIQGHIKAIRLFEFCIVKQSNNVTIVDSLQISNLDDGQQTIVAEEIAASLNPKNGSSIIFQASQYLYQCHAVT